ncbi:MAG: hypothetical protein HEQ39_16580 [Rhizobacter sp.]
MPKVMSVLLANGSEFMRKLVFDPVDDLKDTEAALLEYFPFYSQAKAIGVGNLDNGLRIPAATLERSDHR